MGQGRFRALARQDLGTWAQTPVLSNFKSCWAGSMAQVIECLPSKLGAMSSKPCTKKRKKGKKKKDVYKILPFSPPGDYGCAV
jgi:hypothetical protein